MERVVVIGGGLLGVVHALQACQRGLDVVHLEREAGPRGASARNFGLVWISGHPYRRGRPAAGRLRGGAGAQGQLLLVARATQRRWAGVYSQATAGELYRRSPVAPGVVPVTGPGGRGMTCSPAIAEETFA